MYVTNSTALFADLQVYGVALSAAQLAGLSNGVTTTGCTVTGAGFGPAPPAPGAATSLPPSPPPLPPPNGAPAPPPPYPPMAVSLDLAYTVTATATLGGYTAASFDSAASNSFVSATASLLKVAPPAVTVTNVADVSAGRRRLTQSGGVAVAFSVVTASVTGASALAASITAVDPAAFVSALKSAGMTSLSGIAVSAPVVTAPAPPVVNLSTVTVASTAALSAALSNLDTATASAQQTAILGSIGTMDLTNLSTAAAENTAALVMAVVGATATLSPGAQNAALNVLASVASAPINVTGGAAQSITSALSSVASSASSSNTAALLVVQNVLSSMAASQSNALVASLANLAPGESPAPATTSSPTIQTLVQVDAPGSTRLTTTPLTVDGSPSAFEPMPVGLVDTSTPVVTQFVSLAFDPNRNPNTTGITRLAFKNPDGSEIPVADAATPIRFTLPAVNLSASPGDQAVCSFWDPDANAYATHGCIGVPNPYPLGHRLRFIDNYQTPDDTSLASAWNITGPMVDGGLCNFKILDCNLDSPGMVFPDPRNPLDPSSRPVSCPLKPNATNATDGSNATLANTTLPRQPVLRVYYGTACLLWRPNNPYGCAWDNLLQAFSGPNCVQSTAPTQCMCRHVRPGCCLARTSALTRPCSSPISRAPERRRSRRARCQT